jgi:hypothetical protein
VVVRHLEKLEYQPFVLWANEGRRLVLVFSGPTPIDKTIGAEVNQENPKAQVKLNLMSEGGRINHGQRVMLDKPSGIPRFAARAKEPNFQRCQRADPA